MECALYILLQPLPTDKQNGATGDAAGVAEVVSAYYERALVTFLTYQLPKPAVARGRGHGEGRDWVTTVAGTLARGLEKLYHVGGGDAKGGGERVRLAHFAETPVAEVKAGQLKQISLRLTESSQLECPS